MSLSEISRTSLTPEKTVDWWKSAVVYQIYPRSFQDSNGDGVGDLRGIRDRLDHLERLGVDVIWLSPVYRSPHADNGYDISDYQDIDPVFGTMADLDALLNAVHARGMKLVMDLVVNHTSDQHLWFRESRSSLDNPKRDWYWWRPPNSGPNGGVPNNWESFFSGSTWELDETTGEYYLHLFDKSQPDLNWENPEVRQAIYKMMRWWLDRGVDGFRMDVINFISKDADLPDGIVRKGNLFGDGFPYYSAGPRLHEFLQEMNREVFANQPGILTVGETPGVTKAEAVNFTDPARREVNMVFQFEHVGLDHGETKFRNRTLKPGELAESLTSWQNALAAVGWNSLYLSNHDQARHVSRFGDVARYWRESATALATILHMQRGTPFIYQGEELGMTNAPFHSIDQYRDIESLNYYLHNLTAGHCAEESLAGLRRMSRDHARTPVQWDASPSAGFTTGQPWISVNPNFTNINAASQYRQVDSVFEHYRQLIALRHRLRVVADGDFDRIDGGDPALFIFERTLQDNDERLLVAANLSSTTITPTLPTALIRDWDGAELLLTNSSSNALLITPLAPWEAKILHRTTV